MRDFPDFVVACRARFISRPRLPFFVCALFTLACLAVGLLSPVREDVRSLIPDSPPELVQAQQLLAAAPFMRFAVLTVGGQNPVANAVTLKERLRARGLRCLEWPDPLRLTPQKAAAVLDFLPSLLNASSYAELERRVLVQGGERLRGDLRNMYGLSGFLQRELTAKDPFALRGLLAERFAGLSVFGAARMREGIAVSADGKHALLLVASPVPMTDSSGSERFIEELNGLARDLPVILTGANRHSAENAAVIKGDLGRVLPLSLILTALIFFIYIRTLRGLALFALPTASLCAACAACVLVFGGLSGIVLGFGGVLLGITTDYAVHVYYALRGAPRPAQALRSVTGPLCLALSTSVCAFCMLLLSRIPVIGQLGIFASAGLIFAFACALFVLPHFLAPAALFGAAEETERGHMERLSLKNGVVIALWLGLAVLLGLLFSGLKMDGDIRRLGCTGPELARDEEQSGRIWGRKDSALVVVSAANREELLERDERAAALLRSRPETGRVTALSDFVPSHATQEQRRVLWRDFWTRNADAALRLTVEAGEGFSPSAFAPFAAWIRSEPPVLDLDGLRAHGLGFAADFMLSEDGGIFHSYIVHSGTEALPPELAAALKTEGAQTLSGERFRQEMAEASRRDIMRFGLPAFLVPALLLAAALRSPSRAAAALLPPTFGLGVVLAVLYLTGTAVNIYHIVALPLIMGLGVDYGIFSLHAQETRDTPAGRRAVLVSALTTLAGFGCLAAARHPALFSIGITVLCGISAAVFSALALVPLLRKEPAEGKR